MRYIGGAVGHKNTLEATKGLLASAKETYGVIDAADVAEHLSQEYISKENDSDITLDPNLDTEPGESGDNTDDNDEEIDEEGIDEDDEENDEDDEENDEDDDENPGRHAWEEGDQEDGSDDDLGEDSRESLGFAVY